MYRTKVGKQLVTCDLDRGFSIRPPAPRCEVCEHDVYHVFLEENGTLALGCTGCGSTYELTEVKQ